MSRIEELLQKLLNGETDDVEAQSRVEAILKNAIEGRGIEGLPEPHSRLEAYLMAIAAKGVGGGDDVLNALINRSITEISSNATIIGSYAFYYCYKMTTADFPAATNIDNYAFENCSALTTVDFPAVTRVGASTFHYCSALTTVDFPAVTSISTKSFYQCYGLTALVLRSETRATLSGTNAFSQTPIEGGTGYIYVPRALVDSYKAATNWSTYAAQFRALEDYTVDGTTTGALDESKI